MIEIDNVRYALSGGGESDALNFVVPDGQRAFVVGPTDSGKSQLLRIAAGLEKPSAGEVRINDRSIVSSKNRALRRRVGYVSQSTPLFSHLNVIENIGLAPSTFGWNQGRIENRFGELARHFHLADSVLEMAPGDLSPSQRQRIATLRSLMLEPTYLILDEPVQGMDRANAVSYFESLISATAEFPPTTLIALTDLELAFRFGQQIIILRDGKFLAAGPPAAIVNSPNRVVQDMLKRVEGLR